MALFWSFRRFLCFLNVRTTSHQPPATAHVVQSFLLSGVCSRSSKVNHLGREYSSSFALSGKCHHHYKYTTLEQIGGLTMRRRLWRMRSGDVMMTR